MNLALAISSVIFFVVAATAITYYITIVLPVRKGQQRHSRNYKGEKSEYWIV